MKKDPCRFVMDHRIMAQQELLRELAFPYVRCITCGKDIGKLYAQYLEKIDKGISPRLALDQIGARRICCRTRLISPPQLAEGSLYGEFGDRDLPYDEEYQSAVPIIKAEERIEDPTKITGYYQVIRAPEKTPGVTRTFIAK